MDGLNIAPVGGSLLRSGSTHTNTKPAIPRWIFPCPCITFSPPSPTSARHFRALPSFQVSNQPTPAYHFLSPLYSCRGVQHPRSKDAHSTMQRNSKAFATPRALPNSSRAAKAARECQDTNARMPGRYGRGVVGPGANRSLVIHQRSIPVPDGATNGST